MQMQTLAQCSLACHGHKLIVLHLAILIGLGSNITCKVIISLLLYFSIKKYLKMQILCFIFYLCNNVNNR